MSQFSRQDIIAIDFDDTICADGFPDTSKGRLIEGAKEYITKLKEEFNAEIIIWTCRYLENHVQDCINFLNEHDIPYDYINENSKYMTFKPEPKIFANVYIDDRANFVDWHQAYRLTAMKLICEGDKNITPQMMDLFWKRMCRHYDDVNRYAEKVGYSFPQHDISKFSKDILKPYILKQWNRRYPDTEWTVQMQKDNIEATERHIKAEPHHPEYWVKGTDFINPFDRDKGKQIEVTNMPSTNIIEMCADWCATGEELGNSPHEWADKNLGSRWDFGESTHREIYRILDLMWNK